MTDEELKQKLFEVMYVLDDGSAGRDYTALRNQHHKNMEWIRANGMQEEYYDYFHSQIVPRVLKDKGGRENASRRCSTCFAGGNVQN